MMHLKKPLLIATLLVMILVNACGGKATAAPTQISAEAIFTAAARTVVARMTATAAAVSPTPQPAATQPLASPTGIPAINTPLVVGTPTSGAGLFTPFPSPTIFVTAPPAGSLCDDSAFVGDLNIPDGTEMRPNQVFSKTWILKNTGTCTWDDGYSAVYAYGDGPMGGTPDKITRVDQYVAPGQTGWVAVRFTAPSKAGVYTSCWRMLNDRGAYFGTFFCVQIHVVKK